MVVNEQKQCKALKYNNEPCPYRAQKKSKYCGHHRYSRFGDANSLVNTKCQFLVGIVVALAGILATVLYGEFGATKSNQKVMIGNDEVIIKQNEEERAKIDKMYQAFDLNPKIKEAVENIFIDILKENDIDENDWPEKLQEIANLHQELLDKWQTFESVDPAVDKLRQQAHATMLKGYYDQADNLFEQAVEIDDKAITAQEENLAKRKVSKSQSLAAQAYLSKTKLNFKKAITLYKQALDTLPASQETIQVVYLNNLGQLYFTTAQYDQAEPRMKHVVEILENHGGEPLPNYGWALNNLAQLYKDTNRLADAELMYRRAVKRFETSLGADHPNVAILLSNLAQLYQATNRLKEAEPLMKRAVEILENPGGDPLPDYAMVLNNLAVLYQATNRLKEAEPLFKHALAIDEASFGKNHPNIAIRLNNLAQLYRHTNRLAEAELQSRRHLEIFIDFSRQTEYRHPHLTDAVENYFGLLIEMGDSEDQARAKVIAMAPDLFGQ